MSLQFIRQGSTYHIRIRSAEELQAAVALDEALWVATGAPIKAFRMDEGFLKQLDTDQDGRIKPGELREALAWIEARLLSLRGIEEEDSTLRAEDLQPEAEAVKKLLFQLNSKSGCVGLEQLRRVRKEQEQRPVSERGVVLPDAAPDKALREWMLDVLALFPGTEHPSGKRGLSPEDLSNIDKTLEEELQWRNKPEASLLPKDCDPKPILTLFNEVREALDRYFHLCEVMQFQKKLSEDIWPGQIIPEDAVDSDTLAEALSKRPIARPHEERTLKFDAELNPFYARKLQEFRKQVIIPLMDRTDPRLSPSDWESLSSRLSQVEAWLTQRPAAFLSGRTPEELQSWLDSPYPNTLRDMIAKEQAQSLTLETLREAEQLALYQKYLLTFVNNFISFPDLYDPLERAAFEEGSLLLDGRHFHLAFRVPDRARYLKELSGNSMFLMIVNLEHASSGRKYEVAVPATAGRQGNLRVGKHGIFHHVDGTEWFATVVHIEDHPISLTEATIAPFIRLGQTLTKKVESLTQSAEKKLDETGARLLDKPSTPAPPAAAPPAPGPQSPAQWMAGGGIALAAMGSSLAFMTKTFAGLNLLQIVGGLSAAVMAVLLPSLIVATIRLNRRDLSSLLEGAGWAVNARMRLSPEQQEAITASPKMPKGSKRIRNRMWWLSRCFWLLLLVWLITTQL